MSQAVDPDPDLDRGDALVVVDVQRDFLARGRLPVPDADAVVPVLERYVRLFSSHGLPVFATRHWHPEGHCSFEEYGGTRPRHCVAGTRGAEFAPRLGLPASATVISKGMDRDVPAGSGFEDTDLEPLLHRLGVHRLFVGGLAFDCCVSRTVLDGLERGFELFVLRDAVRAGSAARRGPARGTERMVHAGAHVVAIDTR